jgi:uncharacterized protein (TIGR00251 family)
MIELREHADGCLLPVRAQPGAWQTAIQGEQAGALKVSVTAAPEQGKANKALVEALAKNLGLKKSQIELIRGDTSREKCFLIRGMNAAEMQERLLPFLAKGK